MFAVLIFGETVPSAWAQGWEENETRVEDARKRSRPVGPLKDARLKIELNATDLDAGIKVFIDSEPWKSIAIFDPHGRMIFESVTRGRLARCRLRPQHGHSTRVSARPFRV